MRDAGRDEILPAHIPGSPFSAPDAKEDELCERIRADARRLAAAGKAPGLRRYLEAIPRIEDRPAVLDTAIVAAIDCAVTTGTARDDVIEALLRDHPHLRSAILAADFLDQTLGSGVGTSELDGPELPCDIGPVVAGGHRRYELRTRLAEGASGVVYRAIDRAVSSGDSESFVAVKCMRDLGFKLPHLFKVEAQRARRVEHGSVARVLDAGEDPRVGEYLVFEYCEGPTLEQWLTRRPARPPVAEAVSLALAVCEGLAAVHRAGFCHGDLHPGNIIVSRTGAPRLIDFGAARSDVLSLATSPCPVGAMGFAAPELFRSSPGVSGQSADTYTVAGLLFWLLTGEPPNGASVEEAEAAISGEGSLKTGLLSHLPRDLRMILTRALSPEPAHRYADVDALAEDLRRFQRREPLAWSPGDWKHRAMLLTRRAPVEFSLAAGIAAAAIVTLVIGAGAVVFTSRSQLTAIRTELAAKDSEVSAAQSKAIAAEATAAQADMAREFAGVLGSFVQSVKSDSDTSRWLAALVLLERYSTAPRLSDQALHDRLKAKSTEFATKFLAPVLERAKISTLEELIVASSFGAQRIEEGKPEEAWRILNLARAGAGTILPPEDPAAIRIELYWAIATVAAAPDADLVRREDVADARRILAAHDAELKQLPGGLTKCLDTPQG